MEQNADTGAPMMPTIDNKQKSGNGLKIATAIACIAAVCGIGLGVYGMIRSSQKDNLISDLKTQSIQNEQKISSLELELAKKEDTAADDYSGDEVSLSDIEAQMLIEMKRQELGYDTWTTGPAKVTKKGDNNYYWVVYGENYIEDTGMSELNVIMHYEDGDWSFNIPGFSGIAGGVIEKYNFKDL